MFYISNAGERNCELRLKRALDYEAVQSYSMTIALKTFISVGSKDRITAKVIHICFENNAKTY